MKEIYVIATAYDEILISNGVKIPMQKGTKILYAYDSKEEAKQHAKRLGVGMVEFKICDIGQGIFSKTVN